MPWVTGNTHILKGGIVHKTKLILSLKKDEQIFIGNDIVLSYLGRPPNQNTFVSTRPSIRIEAPHDMVIRREKVEPSDD